VTSRPNIEIEHKFLVVSDEWRGVVEGVRYRQGYVSRTDTATVRVRAGGGQGSVAVKGKRKGYTRAEFEYEIPIEHANTIIDTLTGGRVVEKTRYRIPYKGFVWEVDEFHGANTGLVMAEVELEYEGQHFEKPDWTGKDVTKDNRYANSQLAVVPYQEWSNKKEVRSEK
jgi:CYTH domain-containing protein